MLDIVDDSVDGATDDDDGRMMGANGNQLMGAGFSSRQCRQCGGQRQMPCYLRDKGSEISRTYRR